MVMCMFINMKIVNLTNQSSLLNQNMFLLVNRKLVCPMTEFSEAEDKEEIDGNTLLLECEINKYVYISGLEVFKFKADDKIIDYISLIGNNMVP